SNDGHRDRSRVIRSRTVDHPPNAKPPVRPRRALAGWRGGRVERWGDPRIAARLAEALDVVGGDQPGELTHGFHSYPARLPPLCARRLVEGTPDARVVLDPFCGSGT